MIVLDNLRLALRLFRLRPGFCAAIVVTLAAGLGAAIAIFSLVYALLLRPLPFAHPDRLIVVDAIVGGEAGRLTLREYRDLERDSRTIDGYAAYYRSQYNVTGGGAPDTLTSTITSSTLFTLLGVAPVQGDVWTKAEDFTRQSSVVIGHRLWQQRFGARPDVVGQSLTMDGAAYRVLGVMPDAFDYPVQTDVFRAVTDYNAPHVRRYSVLARLRPDASLRAAQAELDAFAARFETTYPDTNRGVSLRATMLRDAYVGRARPFVLLLLGAVGLLLLIASANVGNLLLSRAVGRRGDVAVRLALGATRGQLVRQSLAEALVLASAGALAGSLVAHWGLPVLTAMVQQDLPPWLALPRSAQSAAAAAAAGGAGAGASAGHASGGLGLDFVLGSWWGRWWAGWFDARMDWAVVVFAVAVTLATALAIGLAPALHASGTDVERALRQDSVRTAGSRRQYVSRRWLVAGQAAVAAVLLVAAGVLIGGLRDLLRRETGFRAESVMTFRVDPPYSRYADVPTTSEFYRRAAERIGTLPGVTAVGANNHLPFSGLDLASPRVSIEGRSQGRADEEPFVNFQLVDAGYFSAMGIALRAGRLFDQQDSLMPRPGVAAAAAAAEANAGGASATTADARARARIDGRAGGSSAGDSSGAGIGSSRSGGGARIEGTTPLVAIVSERAARRFWGDEPPLGKRLRVTWNNDGVSSAGGADLWLTVVGVVANVRFQGLDDDAGLDVYATHRQLFAGDSYFVIRSASAPAALAAQLAAAVREVDPDQAIFDLRVMQARVDASIWQQRVAGTVLLLFALMALALASLGTYAVTAHAVAAQRCDIAIRLALGSSPSGIGWLVMRQWVTPVLLGAAAGAITGLLLARVLTQAIGMTMPGLLLSLLLPLTLVAAAAVACAVPARRVTRRLALTDVLRAQ